jgi:hypothetical protein
MISKEISERIKWRIDKSKEKYSQTEQIMCLLCGTKACNEFNSKILIMTRAKKWR